MKVPRSSVGQAVRLPQSGLLENIANLASVALCFQVGRNLLLISLAVARLPGNDPGASEAWVELSLQAMRTAALPHEPRYHKK